MPPIYRERMNEKKNYTYHLIAIFTVGVWGLTFISTKVLIANGLSPKEIFLLRFLIAYIGIWFISPRKLFANNWKDELWLLLGGITGGSVYFLTENMALGITLATNVAFIVCIRYCLPHPSRKEREEHLVPLLPHSSLFQKTVKAILPPPLFLRQAQNLDAAPRRSCRWRPRGPGCIHAVGGDLRDGGRHGLVHDDDIPSGRRAFPFNTAEHLPGLV